MGYSRLTDDDWARYSSTVSTKSTQQIFTASATVDELNPFGIAMRESRDSALNPESTAIIVAGDVTGSMGEIAGHIVRHGLGVLMKEIYDHKPVTDPAMMIMAVGDAGNEWRHDRSPLQVTQFESDISLAKQVERIHVEGGGLGNGSESYHLPWWFAARRTSIDCFERRGKKGLLFTYGDECPPDVLTAEQIKRVLGETVERDYATREVLAMVSRTYDVFHIVIAEGDYASHYADTVRSAWNALLPERVIWLTDHTKIAETITSAIRLHAGHDRSSVVGRWSGGTAVAVRNALAGMVPAGAPGAGGLIRLR